MYASVVDIQFQPGKMDEAIGIVDREDLGQLEGLQQFHIMDRGDDRALVVAIYDTEQHQSAAGPIAQQLLGRMASLMAAPPNREACEVIVHEAF